MKKMMKLTPIFKDYIWGGKKLKSSFGKESDLEKIAESWELCCHQNGTNGVLGEEVNLEEFIRLHPECLGEKAKKFERFPVLIKLIDAEDNLSIQVHPADEYALKNENSFGKTEMWYVVDCAEDAYLYYGFEKEISKEEFQERIEKNTLPEVLNKVPIKKGDVFFIEAGTIHAICKNTLIAEIQQNSDITYRVYDYGRVGKDGKPRELHVAKALEVTNLTRPVERTTEVLVSNEAYEERLLAQCEYFETRLYKINKECQFSCVNDSFNSLLCLDGKAMISCGEEKMEMNKGDSVFVSAGAGEYQISGECEVIFTKLP